MVSFATISLSYSPESGSRLVTLVHVVRDRSGDFTAQAEVATLIRRLRSGEVDLAGAEQELDRIEHGTPAYHRSVTFLAPATSAAAATVIFGGSLVDAAATFAIVLAVQPILTLLDRTSMVPFFRLAFAVLVTTLAAVAVAALTDSLDESLVLTGALLRFLPGGAPVAGARDLIDGSVVSGTARLAEALMLAAAVAGGASVGLNAGGYLGVSLGLTIAGPVGWPLPVAALAAAVAAYAARLGVPGFALLGIGLTAAAAWATFFTADRLGTVGETFVAAAAGGILARLLSLRAQAPAALWVVPAILPLLPGLAMVNALLAPSDAARVAGLTGAIVAAFALGTGVALGDLAGDLLVGLRQHVVRPAVGAALRGIDILAEGAQDRLIAPIGDALGGHRRRPRRDRGTDESDPRV